MNPYVIYGLFHRDDPNHVHYAGQTRVGLDKRRRGHFSTARTGGTTWSAQWIRENWDDVVFRVLIEADSPDQLDDLEIETISHLWSIGQAELNILPGGGNSPRDWVPSEALKKRWSEQRRFGGIGTSKISVSDVLEIRRLSSEGLPDREIASLFEVGVQGVGHILRGESWGYVPWEPGTEVRSNPQRPRVSEDEWHSICTDLSNAETVTSVSQKYGVSRGRISKYLRENPEVLEQYGLDQPEVVEARKRAKYAQTSKALQGQNSCEAGMTDEIATEVKNLLWQGYRQQDVADHLGVSKNAVNLLSSGASWRHIPWPIGPRPNPKGKKKTWKHVE